MISTRPFTPYTARTTFTVVKEPRDASDYITAKRARATFCVANGCVPAQPPGITQENLLRRRQSNQLRFYACAPNTFDHTQLYTGLWTQLDLSGNLAILSGAAPPYTTPTTVNPGVPNPTTAYIIDRNGNLFGTSECGLLNYDRFMEPAVSSSE